MKTLLSCAAVTLSAATLLLASTAGAGAGGFVMDAGPWRYVAGHNGGYWTSNPHFQQPVPRKWIALGEVSLTGQIKPISHSAPHINEARKFGIEKICLAEQQRVDAPRTLIRTFRTVYDLLSLFSSE